MSLSLHTLVVALAIAAGYGCYRISKIEALHAFRPYALILVVGFWGGAGLEVTFGGSYLLTDRGFLLGLFVLTFVGVTHLEWFRNLMAGITIAFEQRFEVDDDVCVGDAEGEIVEFGLRAIRIRGNDGQIHEIPNVRFVSESVVNPGRGDCACDIVVEVPDELSVDDMRQLARRSALLTPLASPRHQPEVFVTRNSNRAAEDQLLIRGYAFNPSYEEHYRSDVLSRLHRAIEQRSASEVG